MNKLAVARQSRSLIPELSDIFTGFPTFAGIPAFAGLRPIFDTRLMRMEEELKDGRSEFSYGSFVRKVALPVGADEDDITAVYDKGIITVSIAVPESDPAEKRVEVKVAPASDVEVDSSTE